MKKIFSLAMLIVGTIIGAGFASGKEISSFFGKASPLVAIIVGVGIFLLCYLFCTIGSIYKSHDFGEVNQKMFGKLHVMTDIILLLNSLIVLSGMLSGMNSLLNPILSIAPAYSILSGVLCAVIVATGINGLLKSNSVIVPFIILFIALVCCFNIGSVSWQPFELLTLPTSIIYVCMNIMLACTVLTTVDEKPKTVFWASLIAALIMTALMLLIILTLNSRDVSSDMPLIAIAANTSKVLYYIAVAAVGTSIFTTMMTALSGLSSWLAPLTGERFAVIASLILGLTLSNLGFSNVVSYLYPVIGIVGFIYVVACVVVVLKRSPFKNPLYKRHAEIHNCGKKT